jgi:hypothetical protein
MNRPVNLTPHMHFDEIANDSYHCIDCGALGTAWDMSYTPCSNFRPTHVSLSKTRWATWTKCLLCREEWKPLPGKLPSGACYTICPETEQSHGWMDSSNIIDNALWKCQECGLAGSMGWFEENVCPNPNLEPCKYCSVALQCAIDCPGMGELLGGHP